MLLFPSVFAVATQAQAQAAPYFTFHQTSATIADTRASGESFSNIDFQFQFDIGGAVPEGVLRGVENDGTTSNGNVRNQQVYGVLEMGFLRHVTVSFSGPVTGNAKFIPNAAAIDALGAGQTVMETYTIVTVEPNTNATIAMATFEVTVTGADENTAPVADAGMDQMIPSGSQVTLDGTDSSDDLAVTGYSWTRSGGTGDPSVSLDESTPGMPTFTADTLDHDDAAVTHVFTLEVSDAEGEMDTDTVTITVTAPPPTDVRTDALERGAGMLASEVGWGMTQAVSARAGKDLPQNALSLGASPVSGETHPRSVFDANSGLQGIEPEYASVADAFNGLEASQLLGISADGLKFAGLWLKGDVRRFKDRSGEGERDGDLKSLHGGLEARLSPRLLVGLGGAWHEGGFDYRARLGVSGNSELELTTLYPYVAWEHGGRSLWAAVGFGSGELKVKEGDLSRTSDVEQELGALGLAQHVELSERIDTVVRVEAFYSHLDVDSPGSGQGDLDYDAFDTEDWRLRGQGEIGWKFIERENLHLRPYASLGLLVEDGGANGIEQKLGLDLDMADFHLQAEGRYHVLDEESRAYGYSLSADYDRGDDDRGLQFGLRALQGGQRSLDQLDAGGLSLGSRAANGPQTEAELGYGVLLGRYGLLKPYLLRRLATERRSSELGLDYQLRSALQVRLAVEQIRDQSQDQAEEERFTIKADLEF